MIEVLGTDDVFYSSFCFAKLFIVFWMICFILICLLKYSISNIRCCGNNGVSWLWDNVMFLISIWNQFQFITRKFWFDTQLKFPLVVQYKFHNIVIIPQFIYLISLILDQLEMGKLFVYAMIRSDKQMSKGNSLKYSNI